MATTGYGCGSGSVARWRVTAKEDWGRNQGYLEKHGGNETEGRGDTFAEAIESIREDVLAWAKDNDMQRAELRSALRSLAYQAEDRVEPAARGMTSAVANQPSKRERKVEDEIPSEGPTGITLIGRCRP